MGRTDFRNSLRANTLGHLSAAGSNIKGLGVRWPESEPGLINFS